MKKKQKISIALLAGAIITGVLAYVFLSDGCKKAAKKPEEKSL